MVCQMTKVDLSSFKQYGRQEMELNRLLKAVKNAKTYKEEVKAKESLSKYLKKTKLDEQEEHARLKKKTPK